MVRLSRSAYFGVTLFVLIIAFSSVRIAADNCDQKCRERHNFYVCPATGATPTYWYYEYKDCFACVQFNGLSGGGFCEKTDPVDPAPNCIESGTTRRVTYINGTDRCVCDNYNVKWFIEAGPDVLNLTEAVTASRYVCSTSAGDPP